MTHARSPLEKFYRFVERRKYEFLLVALLQHLFIAVLIPDVWFYTRFVWPVNMLLLGIFSVGIFAGKSATRRRFKGVMQVVVAAIPALPILGFATPLVMTLLSISYIVFFAAILVEVLRHLVRPSYINADILSASACGYLLLIEIGTFTMQALSYLVPDAFHGTSQVSFGHTYLDYVYFSAITVTSIGFGDITPAHHITKLATSMLGVAGQLYSIVLVGIIIGKYTSSLGTDADKTAKK